MPVSFLPIMFPLAVFGIFIGGYVTTWVRYDRCRTTRHTLCAVVLLFIPGIVSLLIGLALYLLAAGGEPRWQLAYADWYLQERNLHQEIVLVPGIPWDEDHFFKYLSESAAQGNVSARRKYIAWIKGGSATEPQDPNVRAAYDEYVRQLGDNPDYSYWRETTLLHRLTMLYVPLAILVQVLMWRDESQYQKKKLQDEIMQSSAARDETMS